LQHPQRDTPCVVNTLAKVDVEGSSPFAHSSLLVRPETRTRTTQIRAKSTTLHDSFRRCCSSRLASSTQQERSVREASHQRGATPRFQVRSWRISEVGSCTLSRMTIQPGPFLGNRGPATILNSQTLNGDITLSATCRGA
jgi:hypothetical protein